MNSKIIMLENWTDQATKQMLHNLIERKQKFDNFKKRHLILMWTSVFISFLFMYYLSRVLFNPYSFSFEALVSAFVSSSLFINLSLLCIGLFGATKVLYTKKEKAEKEYHELRCEIIDRSKDLWKDEAWKKRHKIYELMKSEWDINLYHESK
jgi:hypothetical protein